MISLLPLASDLGLVRHLSSAQYPYGLCVEGVDVIAKVRSDSIAITEAGPGGVSSMSFSIADTTSTVNLADGAEVRLWDYVRDLPVFLGFIERVSTTAWAAAGRTIDVSVAGIESLLDTTIVPSLTFNWTDTGTSSGTHPTDGDVMAVVGALTGLRAGTQMYGGLGGTFASSLVNPIGRTYPGSVVGRHTILWSGAPAVTLDGMTVRQAVEAFRASAVTFDEFGTTSSPPSIFLSVDFWGGIRMFIYGTGVSSVPSDYATLTITDNPAGSVAPTSLTWTVDSSPGAVTSAVYVKGTAPDSTGWVVGDTSITHRQGYATTQGDTPDSQLAAAASVMGTRATPAGRGTLTLANYTPTNVHPGSSLLITDTRMGNGGWFFQSMLITEIRKTILQSGKQNWTVSFIDATDTPTAGRPSSMRTIRGLTRGTAN